LSDETKARYFLIQEKDYRWSICDRLVAEGEQDHKLVTGLDERQARELVAKLNRPERDDE
jgi:hypothetical protein